MIGEGAAPCPCHGSHARLLPLWFMQLPEVGKGVGAGITPRGIYCIGSWGLKELVKLRLLFVQV